jgi:hypothetical protein
MSVVWLEKHIITEEKPRRQYYDRSYSIRNKNVDWLRWVLIYSPAVEFGLKRLIIEFERYWLTVEFRFDSLRYCWVRSLLTYRGDWILQYWLLVEFRFYSLTVVFGSIHFLLSLDSVDVLLSYIPSTYCWVGFSSLTVEVCTKYILITYRWVWILFTFCWGMY